MINFQVCTTFGGHFWQGAGRDAGQVRGRRCSIWCLCTGGWERAGLNPCELHPTPGPPISITKLLDPLASLELRAQLGDQPSNMGCLAGSIWRRVPGRCRLTCATGPNLPDRCRLTCAIGPNLANRCRLARSTWLSDLARSGCQRSPWAPCNAWLARLGC